MSDRGGVLLAIDTQGRRHLLVAQEEPGTVVGTVESDNLALVVREHNGIGYVDLVCSDQSLGLVFERLCSDVVSRAEEPQVTPYRALMWALDEWQTLFENVVQLSREEHVGLFGELVVLENLARIDPINALNVWTGPERTLRDFTSSKAFVEVKTTTSQDAARVTISSLDQLDPVAGEPLYLAMVSLRNDPMGDSVGSLMNRLVGMGVPKHALQKKIAQYGFRFIENGKDSKFSVNEVFLWRITDESPGLRRSELGARRLAGIESIKYSLAVEALGDPCDIDESEAAMRLCLS
ncbi:PD-(D/E)XK motif protein [Arthrobacter zhaoxinii]|uniref:PD-(D/E)XK motif protein n=1 Tax=Arthrobacter zhaoxinii TaxID=2964616 RepID=A0ABY5YSE0_9MICC|nr:PD-(D/E)XK motif protein [Arthrobacter zhaoxinii]UWX97745.1 PD-(D/E)XK motif protein [Arthrobacter zhaoxinii]